MVGEEMMSSGRLFQTVAPATGKARSPIVDRRVLGTVNRCDAAERIRFKLAVMAGLSLSARPIAGLHDELHIGVCRPCQPTLGGVTPISCIKHPSVDNW